MITISLDEQGAFEKNNLNEVLMIAGIIFDDKGVSKEVDREKSRIRRFFTRVCNDVGATYPQDLHMDSSNNPNKRSRVANVKSKYTKQLAGFLKDSKYNNDVLRSDDGKERQGEYYVYTLVKSKKGKTELVKEQVSDFIDEALSSNLYMHMVEDVLSRILFYNNLMKDKEDVTLQLATRVYAIKEDENVDGYINHGYSVSKDGKKIYLTNKDVFRTSLERDMLMEDDTKSIISLLSNPIDYGDSDSNCEFLYLADAICTHLGYRNTYDSKDYIEKVWKKMYELTGDNRLLFLYDDVDTAFTKAWRRVNDGEIYGALSVLYDGMDVLDESTKFYRENWLEEFNKHVLEHIDFASFSQAVRKYNASTQRNNINQQKLVYIFEALEAYSFKIHFKNEQDKAILHKLYSAGIAAYNHISDTENRQRCILESRKYELYVSIEKEIRNRNKEAVGLCDVFRYEEAAEIVEKNIEYYNKVTALQKILICEDAKYNSLELAICYSQLGQIYAYMQKEEAEECFLKALDIMDEGTSDYYISLSYLLHYYLQSENKDKYVRYAKEYFGDTDDLSKQLKFIINCGADKNNSIISMKFAMYVYLKGIYMFFKDDISDELKEMLMDIEGAISTVNKESMSQLNGHPWELSYKYLALIACEINNDVAVRKYRKYIESCIAKDIADMDSTIKIIQQIGCFEVDEKQGINMNVEQRLGKIYELIIGVNEDLKGMECSMEAIDKIITYMYR